MYKVAVHCPKVRDVCCEEQIDKKETQILDLDLISSTEPSTAKDSCEGTCLPECPLNTVKDTLVTNIESEFYGEYTFIEKSSIFKARKCANPCHKCCIFQPGQDIEDSLCGKKKQNLFLNNRISLGTPSEGEFPWVVKIFETPRKFRGAGTLITPFVVLTAAHKLKTLNDPSTVRVESENSDEYIQVERIVRHENFDPKNHINNIALLFLKHPIEGHICLPSINEIDVNSDCIISGWGKNTEEYSNYDTRLLRKATVKIVEHNLCQQQLRNTRLGQFFTLHESFICAIGPNGEDSCKGDGGGPLMCPLKSDNSRYFQMGITSWGIGCGNPDAPGKILILIFLKFL